VVPQNGQRLGRLVLERARWDVVEDAGARHTLAHQLVETHWSQMRLAAGRSDAAGAENLFDCAEQAVAVGKDDAVELVALRFLDRARPERFDVKANGGDGRLQLVCDCVDERVMLLVTPDFPDEEDRVEHDARDDEGGEDDPEEEQNAGSPPPQRPADVQQYAEERHPDAERDEEGDGLFAAGPDHGPSLRHSGRTAAAQQLRGFAFGEWRVEFGDFEVPREAEALQEIDQNPGVVYLIPCEAVTNRRRIGVVIVVPAFAKRERGNPPVVP